MIKKIVIRNFRNWFNQIRRLVMVMCLYFLFIFFFSAFAFVILKKNETLKFISQNWNKDVYITVKLDAAFLNELCIITVYVFEYKVVLVKDKT